MARIDAPILPCGTIGAGEAVARARRGDIQLLDATWTLPGNEPSHGQLAGTSAVLDTAAIKALPLSERTPDALGDMFRKAGLSDGPQIAVYDRAGVFSAPWAWWMLLEVGHASLVVQGWDAEGDDDSSGPGQFDVRRAKAQTATLEDVVGFTGQIIDARPAGRFAGSTPEPRQGLRSGHIPGSLNIPMAELKASDPLRYKTPAELHDIFTAKGVDLSAPIITSCGSGVTASGLAFCLSRAGATDVRVYMGSWAEYGASTHPVETGT